MVDNLFKKVFHRRPTTMEKYLSVIILLYIVVVGVKNPLFFNIETVFDMVRGGTGTLVLAMGVLVVLVSGGIDVSFTAVAIVSGYSTVLMMNKWGLDYLWFALIVSVLIGMILGSINGFLVNHLNIPTLIVTLGTMSVYWGLMAVILGTKDMTASEMPQSLVRFGTNDLYTFPGRTPGTGLSLFIIPAVLVMILTWFILQRTVLGRSIYALGSSEESALRLGINVYWVKIFVYSFMGALAGLMGIIYFSEIKYVNPTSLVGKELMIIAAVVVGGAKLTGGEGTILGTFLGVLLLQLFQTTLVFLGLGSAWNDFFFGGVLVISLSVMYLRQRRLDRKNLVFSAD